MKSNKNFHVEPIRPVDGILKKDGRLPGRWRKVRFQNDEAPKEICANTLSDEEQKEMDRAVEVSYEDENRNLKRKSEATGAEKEEKPFWEKRRGVEGESGPSAGRGSSEGSPKLPRTRIRYGRGGMEHSE